jgi:hypothetical protein
MTPSFALNAIQKLRQSPKRYTRYALGRFHTVRKGYGSLMGFMQRHALCAGLRPASNQVVQITRTVDEIVQALEEQSVSLSTTLPEEACQKLVEMSKQSKLRHDSCPEPFYYHDIRDHRLPNGKPAILVDVLDAHSHPLVQDIVGDECVLLALERYMGYRPMKADAHIMWSFTCPWGDKERIEAGQTILYHFDAYDYNFVFAFYYLTRVDHTTGAHMMVCGSHGKKPMSWLLDTAGQSEGVLVARYGADSFLTLEGPPGYGFLQDSSCYHKALAPISADRLMLIIRYS